MSIENESTTTSHPEKIRPKNSLEIATSFCTGPPFPNAHTKKVILYTRPYRPYSDMTQYDNKNTILTLFIENIKSSNTIMK